MRPLLVALLCSALIVFSAHSAPRFSNEVGTAARRGATESIPPGNRPSYTPAAEGEASNKSTGSELARSVVPANPRFSPPLAGPLHVARPMDLTGPESAGYGPGHRGVDLLGRIDEPVLAAGSGLVLHAGRLVDRDVISIEHPGGLRTTYEPVAPLVGVGDRVTPGQPIGHLVPGHPGCHPPPDRACLHFGLRRGKTYLDPVRLLGQGTVRLLPWARAPPG